MPLQLPYIVTHKICLNITYSLIQVVKRNYIRWYRGTWPRIRFFKQQSTAKRRITQTTPRDSPGTLVFWRRQSLVGDGDRPLPLKFALKVTHPPSNTTNSTNIRSQRLNSDSWRKSSFSTNRKSITCFPTSHIWTVYVTPKSTNWHKTWFRCFWQ